MKPKIGKRGAGIAGLLRYMKDGRKHEHSIKSAVVVSSNMAAADERSLEREFMAVRSLRPDITLPFDHHVLSLTAGESLTQEQWDALIRDYLAEMGIDTDTHQFHAMRHTDTKHEHVHIAVNRVALDSTIWLGQKSAMKAIEACQMLEIKYGLNITKGLDDPSDRKDRPLTINEQKQLKKGIEPVRLKLLGIVREARDRSKTFAELVAALAQKGVTLAPNGLTGGVSGVSFKFQATLITGSKLGKDCSWNALSTAVNYDPVADAALIGQLRETRGVENDVTVETETVSELKRSYRETVDAAMADLFATKSTVTMEQYEKVVGMVREFRPELFEKVDAELRAQLVPLGQNGAFADVYTSAAVLKREQRMIRGARMLAQDMHHDLSLAEIESAFATKETEASAKAGVKVTISDEQRAAVRHGFKGGFAAVQGSAGAGKTFLAECIRIGYEDRGYQVLGASIAKRGAQNLEHEAGIRSFTVAMLLSEIKAKRIVLDRKTLIVLDEAGQVGSGYFAELVTLCEESGAKLVATGEDRQADAIQHGGSLRLLSRHEVVGTARVMTIKRQRELWARTAVAHYRDGKMAEGFALFEERGLVTWVQGGANATQSAVINAWRNYELANPGKASLILAHSNANARTLGAQVRDIRKAEGLVSGPEYSLTGTHAENSYELVLSQGDRIRFGKNDEDGIGAINGTLGSIVAIKHVVGADGSPDFQLAVRTDDRGDIEFRTSEYCDEKGRTYLAQAYATTIYSSQGLTVDGDVFMYQTPGIDRALAYVGNSRAKDRTHTFIDQDAIAVAAKSNEYDALREHLFETMSVDKADRLATEVLMANDPEYFAREYGAFPTVEAREERDDEMSVGMEEQDGVAAIESLMEALEAGRTEVFGMDSAVTMERFEEAMVELQERAPEFAAEVEERMLAELVECGRDEGGRPVFTTAKILARETAMVRDVRTLVADMHHDLTPDEAMAAIQKKEAEASRKSKREVRMTEEQCAAVMHTFTAGGFTALQGSAGAGKSFAMEVVKIGYQNCGYEVYGAAIAKRAARNLELEAGIESFTVAKLLNNIQRGDLVLNEKTCIIVDEAGQVGTGYLAQLASQCRAAGSKLVFTGEDRQLDAITHGGVLRFVSRDDIAGTARIQTIQRQDEDWAKQAVADYRDGNMEAGLRAFEQRGLVYWKRGGEEAAQQALIADWRRFELDARAAHAADPSQPMLQTLILAHSNAAVRELGEQVRQIRRDEGVVKGPDYVMKGVHGDKAYALTLAQGDRIRFNLNAEKNIGVINGTLGSITRIVPIVADDGEPDYLFTVQTDDRGEISFKGSEYCDERGRLHLGQAYASTVYSAQGLTIHGDVFVYQTRGMDRAHTYVANSRAKGSTHTYVDRDAIQAMARSDDDAVLRQHLLRSMSREGGKKMATEYLVEQDDNYIWRTFGSVPADMTRREHFATIFAKKCELASFRQSLTARAAAPHEKVAIFPDAVATRARFAKEAADARNRTVTMVVYGPGMGFATQAVKDLANQQNENSVRPAVAALAKPPPLSRPAERAAASRDGSKPAQ